MVLGTSHIAHQNWLCIHMYVPYTHPFNGSHFRFWGVHIKIKGIVSFKPFLWPIAWERVYKAIYIIHMSLLVLVFACWAMWNMQSLPPANRSSSVIFLWANSLVDDWHKHFMAQAANWAVISFSLVDCWLRVQLSHYVYVYLASILEEVRLTNQ